jgi:hypothetical protein
MGSSRRSGLIARPAVGGAYETTGRQQVVCAGRDDW